MVCLIIIAFLCVLHLLCLLYFILRNCTLGIKVHFGVFNASGSEVVHKDYSCGNVIGRLLCCCLWPLVRRRLAAAKAQRKAAREMRRSTFSSVHGPLTSDAGTMTDARGLYLYMYRQGMQEGSLLGGRNSMATATSEPKRLPFASGDASLAPTWETTPLARAPLAVVATGTSMDDEEGDLAAGGAADGQLRARAHWGFSTDAAVMTDSIEELAGGSKGTAAPDWNDQDVGCQLDPIVVDDRHEQSDLCFAYYANYPAVGSQFSGPWRCPKESFYNGAPIQIEFERAPDTREPAGHRSSLWQRTVHRKIPLCALVEEVIPRQHAVTVQATQLSMDDAGSADPSATVVKAAKLSMDDAGVDPTAASASDGYRRTCYVASCALDGDALIVSRGYVSSEGGHCGSMWRLARVGARPVALPDGRPLSVFAGAWQCDRGDFYGGSVVEIDVDGDVSRWFPRGGSLATYTKVDLIDLMERSLEADRFMALSMDDGGLRKPEYVEHHHIASLSASQHTLTVSRAYGDSGHEGETWTLHRILDCSRLPLHAHVPYRTFKHVYANATSQAAYTQATKALQALRTVEFNGARELGTKESSRGISQAWSMEHLDEGKRAHNDDILHQVANVLRQHPELVCDIHGTTTAPRYCDPDLAKHFRLDPAIQMQEVMDALARERATACMEALVGRGVDARRMRVTFKGCSGESRVHFIARAAFREISDRT